MNGNAIGVFTMKPLRNLSIHTKLTLLSALAMALALGIACAVLAYVDIRRTRLSNIKQLRALAEVLATNSTAAISSRIRQITSMIALSQLMTAIDPMANDGRSRPVKLRGDGSMLRKSQGSTGSWRFSDYKTEDVRIAL